MRRFHYFAALVLTALAVAAGPAHAREVLLYTDALRVENIDDEPVMVFARFRAVSEEYTLTGLSGRFDQRSETMEAYGSDEEPATLVKTPAPAAPAETDAESEAAGTDRPMSISATRELRANFEEERLFATGRVRYASEETVAESDLLMVDRREAVLQAVADLLARLPAGEPRTLVDQFFAGIEPEARLVLLQGNVVVDRNDVHMTAAWMVFEEADQENFISVASPDEPLQLRVLLSDDRDEADGEAAGAE